MNLINRLSNFLLYPCVTNLRNVFDNTVLNEIAAENEAHPFTVNIDVVKHSSEKFTAEFTYFDNVEKEIVSYQKIDLKRGEITENIGEGKLISYTEAKISDRGERLIYSSSLHFEEYTLFHERMAIRIGI